MSFETLEESRYLGQPVDLYYFRYGTTASAYYAYTDAEEPITFDGVIYKPLPIRRGAINSSGTLDKSALQVEVPVSSDVAELFRIYPPGRSVAIIIRQGHLDDVDNDFKVIWSGRVLSSSREDSIDTLTCEPLSTAFRRSGLRRCYQYSCPHALYGTLCMASRLAATRPATVYSLTGASVTLDSGWNGAHAVEKYIGGMIEWETAAGKEVRTILRLTNGGNTLNLSGATRGLTGGMEVSVILGCEHNMADCENLHNNIQNYGGQPWIPLSSPIKINPYW